MILNFSQVRYYQNYSYDGNNIIYQQSNHLPFYNYQQLNYPPFHNYNIIYQQPNPSVEPCPIYNFFGGSSTYQETCFEDNCSNLDANLNLSELDGNLSLDRTEEPSNIVIVVM
jgi:hypothetical protein